jgi:aminoglycoside phosphotransferase (APT) family kinase protein
MDRISLESPYGLTDVVLRRWPAEDWTTGLVTREAWGLEAIRGHGVPAPRLLGMDEDGTETGVRCTLTSALTGQPDLTPTDMQSWLGQLAATQAAIHAVPPGSQLPCDDWGGDYQHFNVLWSAGRLTGVVDWPNAASGNRGSDVGHCRLNLAVLFDAQTADKYLMTYERAAGARTDRRADLRALLCFDLEWQRFIPHQVDGRAPLDLAGMPGRVAAAIRSALSGLG